MIHFTPRTFAGWVGAWALAAVNGLIAALSISFVLALVWLDDDDTEWAAFADIVAAGAVGFLVGSVIALVISALGINRWVSPGRGWRGSWAVVWSFVVSVVIVVVALELGGDEGPADIIAGWAIVPLVLAAHLAAIEMIDRRLAVGTWVTAVSVVAVAVIVS